MKFPHEKFKQFEHIFSLTQSELKKEVTKKLAQYYPPDKIIKDTDYIYTIGNIPIALVAHLDTVWEDAPPSFTLFDPFRNVMWAPNGLGADDRAGVLAIFEILKLGLRPHIIFTTDEEIGGMGASSLAFLDCPFPDLRYIIELDRRGREDCVFYDCENEEFQKYIENFGFKTAIGSFSDISILCGAWQKCGVNLSIGYLNEHTHKEMLFLTSMYLTISKVVKMLKSKQIPEFKWEGPVYIPYYDSYNWNTWMNDLVPYQVACKKCHSELGGQDWIATQTAGGGTAYYCHDCMLEKVAFCVKCGQPYECNEGIAHEGLCYHCKPTKEETNVIHKL